MSVVWKLDKDHNIRDVWYGLTVVRSRYKLSYEVAQQLYDGVAASQVARDIPELMNSDLKREELRKRWVEFVVTSSVLFLWLFHEIRIL